MGAEKASWFAAGACEVRRERIGLGVFFGAGRMPKPECDRPCFSARFRCAKARALSWRSAIFSGGGMEILAVGERRGTSDTGAGGGR